MTAAVASRQHPGIVFTETAALCFATVLDYLGAEVLELAGNAVKDFKGHHVTPRHIALAIRGDEELDAMCMHAVIVGGGVLPHIHKGVLSKPNKCGVNEGHQFDELFAGMLAAAPGKVLVDPRDGNHYRLNPHYLLQRQKRHEARLATERDHAAARAGNGGELPFATRADFTRHPPRFVPLPELDTLSAQSAPSRQRAALAELSAAGRAAFDADACNSTVVRERRLRMVRDYQKGTELLLDRALFAQLVNELGRDAMVKISSGSSGLAAPADKGKTPPTPRLFWSREAIEALQWVTEDYLICIFERCMLHAVQATYMKNYDVRLAIMPKDIQLARRMGGERV
jgi:histone H3/H4